MSECVCIFMSGVCLHVYDFVCVSMYGVQCDCMCTSVCSVYMNMCVLLFECM